MPTRPLSTFPCLSFPRALTRTRLDTVAGNGQPGRGNPSPEQPLAPSPHTRAAAARPRRRHVLSPVECAKSLPDVHGGQPDPPPLPPGQPPATGDPEHSPTGPSPSAAASCPATAPSPVCPAASRHRGPAVPRQRGGQESSGCQGAAGAATRTGWPCPRGTEAPQSSPGAGAAGSCGVLPRTPGPGARREQPSGKGLSDGIWVPAVTARREAAVPATWPLM